jgi:hypothetical protein
LAVVQHNAAFHTGFLNRRLRGALGALRSAHDLIPQFVVTRLPGLNGIGIPRRHHVPAACCELPVRADEFARQTDGTPQRVGQFPATDSYHEFNSIVSVQVKNEMASSTSPALRDSDSILPSRGENIYQGFSRGTL